MSLGKRIRAIRKNADMTQEEFGRKLGLSAMAVSQWENDRAVPRMGALQQISEDFDIPMSELLQDTETPESLFPRMKRPASFGAASVPLFAIGRVHAGKPMEEEEASDKIEVPSTVFDNHPRAFALAVEGDCMNRVVPEGAHVLIDPDTEPVNGSIAVVEDEDHMALMRRWYRGSDSLMLVADSFGSYPDIVRHEEDGPVKVLGTVVWYQSAEEME